MLSSPRVPRLILRTSSVMDHGPWMDIRIQAGILDVRS